MTDSRLTKEVKTTLGGLSLAVLLKVAGAISFLFLHLVIGRIFGANGLGHFTISVGIAYIGATIACLGLENVVLRISATKDIDAKQLNSILLISLLVISLMVAISIAVTVGLTAQIIDRLLLGELGISAEIQVAAMCIPFISLLTLSAGILRGDQKIAQSQIVQALISPLITLTLVLLFNPLSVLDALKLFAIGAFLGSLVGLAWVDWSNSTLKSPKLNPVLVKSELRRAGHLFPISLSTVAIAWLPGVVIGGLSTATEAGIFQVAYRLSNLMGFLMTALNLPAAPQIARLYGRQEWELLVNYSRTVATLSGGLGILIYLVLIVLGTAILGYFGEQFQDGYPSLLIMGGGQLVSLICGSVGYLLVMSGNEADYRNINILSFLVLLISLWALIPGLGANGAALALAVCISLTNILALFLVRVRLGFWNLPRIIA